MSISKKIKTIDNTIDQSKAQCNLDRQIAKISALPSGNGSRYEFLTGEGVVPEKDLPEKVATIKRFEYLPLSKELKTQASVAEKQYQKLNKFFKYDDEEVPVKIRKEKQEITCRPKRMYNNKYTFRKYKNVRKYLNYYFKKNCNRLVQFYHQLKEFKRFNPQTVETKEKRRLCMIILKIFMIFN